MSFYYFFFLWSSTFDKMAILKKRDDDDDDTTIYLTITSTSTMNTGQLQPTGSGDESANVVTWVQQTSLQTLVTSLPVTLVSTVSAKQRTTSTPLTTTVIVSPASTTQLTQTSLISSTISSETSSVRRIGSMSDVPNQSTFGDIPVTSSTNRSTEIGLAIGIPIAIFSIFFIGLAIWYYIRSRKSKKQDNKYSFNDSYYKSRSSDETITPERPYPVVFSPGAYLRQEIQSQNELPARKDRAAKRSSKMFPARKKEQEQISELPPESSRFMKRMSMMTPIFLKKFNLGKIEEPKEDTIKPQVLTIDSDDHKDKITNAMKNKLYLPPTIVIGESGLDPVRGGSSPSESIYTVIRSYAKNLSDELDIEVGDKVVILEKHSDGWCKVRKIHMGKEYYAHQSSQTTGLVPRMCLQKI